MIVAGNVGVAINILSYANTFKVAISADDGILSEEDTKLLAQLIESNINYEIERAKDFPVPIKKKKE